MRVVILRHGTTELNKQGMIQGSSVDPDLSKEGRAYAEKAAKNFDPSLGLMLKVEVRSPKSEGVLMAASRSYRPVAARRQSQGATASGSRHSPAPACLACFSSAKRSLRPFAYFT